MVHKKKNMQKNESALKKTMHNRKITHFRV